MHAMSPEKKQQLIEQVRGQFDKNTAPSAAASSTYGPPSGSLLLPRIVPQFSGDSGFFKRMTAFPTWGSTTSPPAPMVNPKSRSSGEFATVSRSSLSSEITEEDVQHIHPQATGSMFSTWWAVLRGETTPNNENSVSARAYVDSPNT